MLPWYRARSEDNVIGQNSVLFLIVEHVWVGNFGVEIYHKAVV